MKVAFIQMNSGSDMATFLAQARSLIEKAVREEKPDWVSLPKFYDFMGGSLRDKRVAAEKLPDGPAWTMMRDLAKKRGVYINGGSILEKVDGEEIARYRKIHMSDIVTHDGQEYCESKAYGQADAVANYDCEGVTVGCTICYDLRVSEIFQALITLPSAFTLQTGKDDWEVLIRARAIETETYISAAGQTGTHEQGNEVRTTYGHSLVVDPWGHVVARLDLTKVKKVRTMMPVAQYKVKLT
jgi:nitrilase